MTEIIPEVSFIWAQDAENNPDKYHLEVGLVVRRLAWLESSETVVKWDGRSWVPAGGDRPSQIESDGEKARVCPGTPHRGHTILTEPCPIIDWTNTESPSAGLTISTDTAVAVKELGRYRYGMSQAADGVADVLVRYLPSTFVTWYSALIDECTGPGTGYAGTGRGVGDENSIYGLGRKTGGMGSVKSVSSESLNLNSRSPSSSGKSLLASEKASVKRAQVDRKLRKIAREMQVFIEERGKKDKNAVRQCSGKCRKFGEADWVYCARCGSPMREVD